MRKSVQSIMLCISNQSRDDTSTPCAVSLSYSRPWLSNQHWTADKAHTLVVQNICGERSHVCCELAATGHRHLSSGNSHGLSAVWVDSPQFKLAYGTEWIRSL